MEPCLNGTLVQADRTNKEVGLPLGRNTWGPRPPPPYSDHLQELCPGS